MQMTCLRTHASCLSHQRCKPLILVLLSTMPSCSLFQVQTYVVKPTAVYDVSIFAAASFQFYVAVALHMQITRVSLNGLCMCSCRGERFWTNNWMVCWSFRAAVEVEDTIASRFQEVWPFCSSSEAQEQINKMS